MSRQSVVLLAVSIAIAVSVFASARGWLGSVVVCGADRAPGCVIWPMPISEGLWLAFIVGVAALFIWQTRT
jgi:hypothetical protein